MARPLSVTRIREPGFGLQPVLDTLPVAAYLCDASGLITYFNPRATEIWGRAPLLNDAADRWCGSFRLFRPDGTPVPHVECWMARAILENRPHTAQEIVIERRDGSRIHGLAHASPLYDETGHLVGAVNVLVDVSDRYAGEEARARLAAIVHDSHDAIISKTLDGVITSWNTAAERLYGYTAAEAVGQHITLIIPPERRAEETEILRRIRSGERIDSYETERLRKDRRPAEVSLTISPIRDDSGRIIGASKISRDISQRKAEERRRQEVEEMLRVSDRRKDEFLAVMAHELRNPLAPLVNSLEVLQISVDPNALRDVLGIVRRQVGTLVRLVDDLMDASRIGRGMIELKPESLLLRDVIDNAVEIARPLIDERRQQLEVLIDDPALRVEGDRTRLTQVAANLLNNAAKYTPPGGRITVTGSQDGTQALLRVTDNGNGIPPEMLSHVFEMFTQVDQSLTKTQGGLGIGLSIVKRLVELHGGSVEARSDGPGRGAEFLVRLPLAVSFTDATHRPMPSVRPAPRRVLVADDNGDAATSIALLLRSLGQEVHVVHNGRDAVERAAALRPDVILLDIGMPQLSGYDVAQRVRREPWGRKPLIIAMTGWGQAEDRQRSKESGFDQHLVKPVTLDALCRVLAQASTG